MLIDYKSYEFLEFSVELLSLSINVTGKVVSVLDGKAILIEAISDLSFQRESIDDTQVVVDPITDDAGGVGGAGYLVAKGEPNRVFQGTIPDVITLINAETNKW